MIHLNALPPFPVNIISKAWAQNMEDDCCRIDTGEAARQRDLKFLGWIKDKPPIALASHFQGGSRSGGSKHILIV